MKITTFTAEHVLQYLLAVEGLERPFGTIATSWPVVKRFLEMPSGESPDLASYQVSHGDSDDPRFVQVVFTRQLTDSADGFGPRTRSTLFTFYWDFAQPFDLEPTELWSSDFAALNEFFEAVEAHPTFSALADVPPEEAYVQVDEPVGEP